MMLEDWEIIEKIENAKKQFGAKCNKYVGAVAIEYIRLGLKQNDIPVSQRNVFIEGVPIEIDLLIPGKNVIPKNGILFEPDDVLAVLEIKNSGAFGENTIKKVKRDFEIITNKNPKIRCYYVTLMERRGYKWTVTEENLGNHVYTLFWYFGLKERIESTGDWEKLINDIKLLDR